MLTYNTMTKVKLSELEQRDLFFHNQELWMRTSYQLLNAQNQMSIYCLRISDGHLMSFPENHTVLFDRNVEISSNIN